MIIYRIINKLDGMEYVGQTVSLFDKRWKGHCLPSSKIVYLRNAIQKYGKQNFTHQILGIYDNLKDLNEAEKYFIEYHNTIYPNGYNLNPGGNSGGNKHPETRKKLSNVRKGRHFSPKTEFKPGQNKGKKIGPFSKEHCDNISKATIGRVPYNKGKKMSKEFCAKIRESKKNLSAEARKNMSEAQKNREAPSEETRKRMSIAGKGKPKSEQHRLNISRALKGKKSSSCKQVVDLLTGFVWESAKEASEIYGINCDILRSRLNGAANNNTSFRYVESISQ